MAGEGLFDPDLVGSSWFDETSTVKGWFDGDLIAKPAAGGGGSQALAITLDGVTVAAAQNLQHSQALAITLDGVTVAAGQARQYSQSLAATLDGVTVAAAQNLRHSQALSATLDDVAASVAQNLRHAQALDATLDGVTVEVAQAKSGENSQSLAVTLDDVSVSIAQQGPEVISAKHGGDDSQHTGWNKAAWQKRHEAEEELESTIKATYERILGIAPTPEAVAIVETTVRAAAVSAAPAVDYSGYAEWIAAQQAVIAQIIADQQDEDDAILALLI